MVTSNVSRWRACRFSTLPVSFDCTPQVRSRANTLMRWQFGLAVVCLLAAAAVDVLAQAPAAARAPSPASDNSKEPPVLPRVISTWNHGLAANEAAWKILANQGAALDAVETGVRVSEADPKVDSVGVGGMPDRTGRVTLDACIMDERGRCGSVAFIQGYPHPISIARRVMEKTPHVMLVGRGAEEFAAAEGFERRDLLTEASRKAWEEWTARQTPEAAPVKNIENLRSSSPQSRPSQEKESPESAEPDHDTIGMVVIDAAGNLSGACTTSGLAWKMHGRVGDSPIIGAGMYVDNDIGAAAATGVGEAVIRTVGSFLVVELMRQGHSPQKACELAIDRVVAKNPNWRDIQVAFIAINKRGEVGAFAIAPGFTYAVCDAAEGNRMVKSTSRLDP